MSEDPELDAKIQDCCATGVRLAGDMAQQICKAKELAAGIGAGLDLNKLMF